MTIDLSYLQLPVQQASILEQALATFQASQSRISLPSELSEATTRVGVIETGEIRLGNGILPGSGFSGLRLIYPPVSYNNETWNFVGIENDIIQVGIRASDGKFLAGAGKVTIDVDGILFDISDSPTAFTTSRTILWNDGTNDIVELTGYQNIQPGLRIRVNNNDDSGLGASDIQLLAFGDSNNAGAQIEANAGTSSGAINFTLGDGSGFVTLMTIDTTPQISMFAPLDIIVSSINADGGLTMGAGGITAKAVFQPLAASGELLGLFGVNVYADASLITQRFNTSQLGWAFVLDGRAAQDLFKLERVNASGTINRPFMVKNDGSFGFGDFTAIPAFTGAKFYQDSNGDVFIGSALGERDYKLTFVAATNSGVLTWMEDEDYFAFSDHIGLKSNKELRFYDNGNYVGFKAPALSADQIWTLPTADGNSGEVLSTNGTGTLSWVAGSGDSEIIARSTSNTSVFNTAAETNLLSFTLPANKLTTDGILKIFASGRVQNTTGVGVTFTIRAYIGTTAITIARSIPTGTNEICSFEFLVQGAGGTSLQETWLEWSIPVSANIDQSDGSPTEDTTGALTIKITLQMPGADANAGMDLRRYHAILFD